jgi:hypothetical protein
VRRAHRVVRPLFPPPIVAAPPTGDRSCLERIATYGVPFVSAPPTRGIETPVTITGPIGGVRLIARAGRPPLMDCELASALAEAAPLFHQLGISGLSFSGIYDYRNVRGTQHLSGHAFGLAIDVHTLETRLGIVEVERDFPRDGDRWHTDRADVAGCIGAPARPEGELVRGLACQLRADPAFRLIMGPDDNYDHRNHLHLEAYPGRPPPLYGARPWSLWMGRSSAMNRR